MLLAHAVLARNTRNVAEKASKMRRREIFSGMLSICMPHRLIKGIKD
jgi:hypothetical protein